MHLRFQCQVTSIGRFWSSYLTGGDDNKRIEGLTSCTPKLKGLHRASNIFISFIDTESEKADVVP